MTGNDRKDQSRPSDFQALRAKSLVVFVACALLLALPLLLAVGRMDRFALHLAMNSHHAPWADAVFPWLTDLADGWSVAVVALLMLFRSWRAFLMVGLSAGLSAILVQALKHSSFAGINRPAMFLSDMPGLQLVQGFELQNHFSFPSGHSTAAFSMCLALAVICAKRRAAAMLAVVAAMLAYSRVYLSMHFSADILAGAALGVLTGAAVYWLLYRGPLSKNARLDRSPWIFRTNTGPR